MFHKDYSLHLFGQLFHKFLSHSLDRSWLFKQIIGLLAVVFLLLFSTQCKKDPAIILPTETNVHFLGHKGGGNVDYNSKHIESSMLSIQDGLKTMNGVEVDLQMSLDGTIWMWHDSDLGRSSCNTNYHRCIALMKDVDIAKAQFCIGGNQDGMYKLEELINLWKNTASGFFISMEVKLDFPSDTINNPLIGGEAAYLSKFANSMGRIFPDVKYKDQLMMEVYDAKFCTKMQATVPDIKICLLKDVPFPQQVRDALDLGYDGVSCIFDDPTLTADQVKIAQDKGLIVQLWTPDTPVELTKALNCHPNFIQTDNLNAIDILNIKVIP
jgi:glycerophosphoryl diester phosphodiesterase